MFLIEFVYWLASMFTYQTQVFYLIIIYKTNFVVKILGLNFRVVSAILTTGIGLATLRTEMAY
jgi:hypothetical protein